MAKRCESGECVIGKTVDGRDHEILIHFLDDYLDGGAMLFEQLARAGYTEIVIKPRPAVEAPVATEEPFNLEREKLNWSSAVEREDTASAVSCGYRILAEIKRLTGKAENNKKWGETLRGYLLEIHDILGIGGCPNLPQLASEVRQFCMRQIESATHRAKEVERLKKEVSRLKTEKGLTQCELAATRAHVQAQNPTPPRDDEPFSLEREQEILENTLNSIQWCSMARLINEVKRLHRSIELREKDSGVYSSQLRQYLDDICNALKLPGSPSYADLAGKVTELLAQRDKVQADLTARCEYCGKLNKELAEMQTAKRSWERQATAYYQMLESEREKPAVCFRECEELVAKCAAAERSRDKMHALLMKAKQDVNLVSGRMNIKIPD